MRNGRLSARVEALEAVKSTSSVWRRIVVDGQSEAEALAAHEQEYGPIGRANLIVRQFVEPQQ